MWRIPHRYLWHKAPSPAQNRFDGIWSISYADMMTLLLCFFVVMLMVCPPPVAHGQKAHSVMASLRSAFGTSVDDAHSSAPKPRTLLEHLVAMTESGRGDQAGLGQAKALTLTHESDGLHVLLRGDRAFADTPASAGKLTPDTEQTLRQLAVAMGGLNPRVEIRVYGEAFSASGNMRAGAVGKRAGKGLDDGFAHAKAVADVLSQCGLPIDRLQLLAVRDAASVRSDPSAPAREAGQVDVIVQAVAE